MCNDIHLLLINDSQMLLRSQTATWFVLICDHEREFTHVWFGSVTFYDTGRMSFDCLGRITALVIHLNLCIVFSSKNGDSAGRLTSAVFQMSCESYFKWTCANCFRANISC